MLRLRHALLVVLMAMLLVTTAGSQPADEEFRYAREGKIILRMATMRVVGFTVIEALVRTYLMQEGLRDISVKRTSDLSMWTFTGMAQRGEKKSVTVEIMSRERSLDALKDGAVDVAVLYQPPAPIGRKAESTELQLAIEKNKIQIGETAAFIIVNSANPIGQMTFRELRLVLLGAITDWAQLGGNPGKIKPVGTPQMQPAIDLVADLIHLDPENLDSEASALLLARRGQAASLLTLATSDDVFNKIAADRNAITIQFPHIPPTVKALSLGANNRKFTEPNADTIKSKEYPLSYRINMHFPGGPKSATLEGLIRAGESLEMQVNLTLAGAALPGTEMLSLRPDPAAPQGYLDATRYGMMVSKSIHFKSDSLELTEDGKSAIQRVADKLLSIRQDAGKIRLIGFADGQGSAEASQALGLSFARRVAEELKKRNVNTGYLYSFGDELPLDEDSTTQGRERNRRVQVWIVP